jgi:hypothetical protein
MTPLIEDLAIAFVATYWRVACEYGRQAPMDFRVQKARKNWREARKDWFEFLLGAA